MTTQHSVLPVITFLPECSCLQMASEEAYVALIEFYSKGIFPS